MRDKFMERNKAVSRMPEIDVLKSFGIILMIMGHQLYGEGLDHWLNAFHMPMFFIISGYLYKKPDHIGKTICRKEKNLLIPYLSFAFFHMAISCVLKLREGISVVSSIKNYCYHIFLYNHEGMPICGAIWFLTALFFLDVIYYLIDLIKNDYCKLGTVIGLSAIGVLIPFFGYRLPLSLDVSLMGTGLYYIGNKGRKLFEKVNLKANIWVGFVGLTIGSLLVFLNSTVNVRLATYGNIVLYYFNAVLLTFSLYNIAFAISKQNNVISKELCFIGTNSLVYLGLNQFILIFLKNISFENQIINTGYKVIALFTCLVILHLCSFVLTRTKLKILIGRF